MSLKNIELQIAIPRTQDAGKIQNELNERSNLANTHANIAVQKEDEKKRSAVIKNEKSAQLKLNKDKQNKNQNEKFKAKRSEKDENKDFQQIHPYKGRFIDYSG